MGPQKFPTNPGTMDKCCWEWSNMDKVYNCPLPATGTHVNWREMMAPGKSLSHSLLLFNYITKVFCFILGF